MRTHLLQLAIAALVASTLTGCDSTDTRDVLAPSVRPAMLTGITPPPPQTCTASSTTSYCQWNFNADLSAGEQVTCSLRLNGAAFCWGSNANAMLGNGSALTTNSSTPLAVAGGRFFSSISVGFSHVCAIERSTGAAFCWGLNDSGQLGDAAAEPIASTPVAVAGGHAFSSISAGKGETCGVSGGMALCWGAGIGSVPTLFNPQTVYSSVSVGEESPFTGYDRCGLSTGGAVCTGAVNVRVLAQGGTADHFCFIDGSNFTKCWGNDYYGQLGDSTSGYATSTSWVQKSPVTVRGNIAFQSVATGGENTCALSSGAAFCWGWNYYKQLGTGTSQLYSWMPQAVLMPTGTTFTKIAVGDGHACALDTTGSVYCWGNDDHGQTANYSNPGVPTKVAQASIL